MQALEAFSLECSILPLRTKIREAQIEGGYFKHYFGQINPTLLPIYLTDIFDSCCVRDTARI